MEKRIFQNLQKVKLEMFHALLWASKFENFHSCQVSLKPIKEIVGTKLVTDYVTPMIIAIVLRLNCT